MTYTQRGQSMPSHLHKSHFSFRYLAAIAAAARTQNGRQLISIFNRCREITFFKKKYRRRRLQLQQFTVSFPVSDRLITYDTTVCSRL